MELLTRFAVAFLLGSTAVVACAEPPTDDGHDDGTPPAVVKRKPAADVDAPAETAPATTPPATTPPATTPPATTTPVVSADSACTSDAGCSATNVGATTCSVEGGRSRISCTKVGACFKWAAATACSPDETCQAGGCATPPACTNVCTLGADRCEGTTRGRETCAKAATGCTAWTTAPSCSPDETCVAGECQ